MKICKLIVFTCTADRSWSIPYATSINTAVSVNIIITKVSGKKGSVDVFVVNVRQPLRVRQGRRKVRRLLFQCRNGPVGIVCTNLCSLV